MSLQILSQFGSTLSQERRRNLRARIALRLRVRTADFSDGDLAQIADTLNASSRGFYFHTPLDRYYKGMRLRIILPYHAGAGAIDWEEMGEVIRIDRKSGCPYGVAVKRTTLLNARGLSVIHHRNDRSPAMAERRLQERFPFVASVEMMDTQTRTILRARTSDLSMSGCYIDTLNPFPVGAILDLRIQKATESLIARVSVRTQHLGSGMGVAFTGLLTERCSTVRNWLFESDPNGGHVRATENGASMSQVFDALRKAEQARKGIGQTEEQLVAVDYPNPQDPDSIGSPLAYLGPGLEIRGEISGNEPLLIDGRVDGLISIGDCRLTVGQTAYVSAKILAGEVVVHGEVHGDVSATERIVIKRDASVSGELTTSRIVIEDGAYIKASVQIRNDALTDPFPSVPANS
jgi:cytoskeletal protein CcmA (bactofilin family)